MLRHYCNIFSSSPSSADCLFLFKLLLFFLLASIDLKLITQPKSTILSYVSISYYFVAKITVIVLKEEALFQEMIISIAVHNLKNI